MDDGPRKLEDLPRAAELQLEAVNKVLDAFLIDTQVRDAIFERNLPPPPGYLCVPSLELGLERRGVVPRQEQLLESGKTD